MSTHTTERRQHARQPLSRPIKLRTIEGGRYLAGTTSDVSAGGALLELQHPHLLAAGQIVQLGIAWDQGQPLLAADRLLDARVVRSLGHQGSQRVAVQFAQAQSMKATG